MCVESNSVVGEELLVCVESTTLNVMRRGIRAWKPLMSCLSVSNKGWRAGEADS